MYFVSQVREVKGAGKAESYHEFIVFLNAIKFTLLY